MGSGLQYKYGGKTRVLEDTSLRALASFARHVDRTPATRNAIAQADELSAVVQIAHSIGFTTVSEEVLVEACLGMTSSTWVWHPKGRRWSDHVFTLALTMLMDGKRVNSSGTELAQFYSYVEGCPAARRELLATRNRQELIAVARAHGFLISEACLEAWEKGKPTHANQDNTEAL
jgi:hypothetical protein